MISRSMIKIKQWQILIVLLCISNLVIAYQNMLTWLLTLGFFLFMPGFLLLSRLNFKTNRFWEVASYSMGLSIFILMVGGLLLNSIHVFGVQRPLSISYIFIMLDLISLVLILLCRSKNYYSRRIKLKTSKEQLIVVIALTAIPLLSIGGAIRLNNEASDILTLLMFGAIAVMFLLLMFRANLKSIYPYAAFIFALSVLLSTSLRGWSITGHDIQHEFAVFQITSNNGYWSILHPRGDPYNACVSLTILPTIIEKITKISPPYVYKIVYQAIFAFGIVPLYLFIKERGGPRRALMGALIFISFPPFFNDMPFLNRQELAFVFFSLLMLVTFSSLAKRLKVSLSVIFLFSLIISHYSSGYVTLSLLVLSAIVYAIIKNGKVKYSSFYVPIRSLGIISAALLFTFFWNSQVTSSTAGLKYTVHNTISGLWGHHSNQSNGVTYSIFSPPTQNPVTTLDKYAGSNKSNVNYVAPSNLPVTRLGAKVSKVIKVESLNNGLRIMSAKLLQLLLVFGLVVLFFRQRRERSTKTTYFFSMAFACLILLVMITILPELSIDYSVTRLFQQTLIITSLVIIFGAEFILGFLGKYKTYAVALLFAFMFLDLSGFIPQLLGGYPAQMALNNSGLYYDIYYVHDGENIAANWLTTSGTGSSISADQYASVRFPDYPFLKNHIVSPVDASDYNTYLYQDYANLYSGNYAVFLNGDVIEYIYRSPLASGNLVYDNHDSKIYYH